MNNVCRQYISEIKVLFPIVGREEKKYISALAENVADYCEEEQIKTIDGLYEKYGKPSDIVASYYVISDMDQIIRKIRISKWIKGVTALAILVITLVSLLWGINTYRTFQIFKQQQVFYEETTIE